MRKEKSNYLIRSQTLVLRTEGWFYFLGDENTCNGNLLGHYLSPLSL